MDPELLPPPPQPPQPHRSSTSCDRHPVEHFTGFCPSCLCERLAVLDHQSSAASSSARKSTSSAIIKSLFKPTKNADSIPALRARPSSSSFLPELRRTKSFSGRKNEGFLGLSFEPQRKSCDVRGRSTLFSLFSQDNESQNNQPNLGDSVSGVEGELCNGSTNHNGGEIEVVREEAVGENLGEQVGVGEIVEEDKEEEEEGLKTMKDHIDLDSKDKKVGTKDLKELAGSFWSAASVFSKKLRSWTKKNNHKMKKHNGSHTVKVSSKKGDRGRSYRDTQSEIADYGYGRRSCDTDPRLSFDVGRFSVDAGRFSVDAAGRFSFDDPRCSFDEPRASWDGYLVGRTFPRMVPPMVSVVEDPPVLVSRKDAQIPVEEPRRSSVSINGEDCVPGGAAQTKDYYSDSSSRRRKSLDRSSSIRKTAAAVVAEMDEMRINACNAKNSPGRVVGDKEVRDLRELNSNSRSLRDECSESFDVGFRDNASVIGNGERKGTKKPRRWRAWNIWGLIQRRGNAKHEEDDRYSRANGVERSFSESWPDLKREGYVDPRGAFNQHVLRSNSSVSWRNSYDIGGSFGGIKNGSVETNGSSHGGKKREDFVLERNRSARYSPRHTENGMLRPHLTPKRGSRSGGSGKPKPAYSHSFVKSALRMY